MKLHAYLVDDEPLALERLKLLLEQTGKVEILGYTTQPKEALAFMTQNPTELCFLDIQMPELSGFEVLERLPKQPIVIFTTAFSQYALQAFEVNSVGYLLKPIEQEALDRALEKIETLTAPPDLRKVLKHIEESMHGSHPAYAERIASRLGGRIMFLNLAEVPYFYAEDKLTYAVCNGKSYSIDYSITDLARKLDPHRFFRIHRSTLVNLNWLSEVSSLPGGSLALRLKGEKAANLTVSRDRAQEFRRYLKL